MTRISLKIMPRALGLRLFALALAAALAIALAFGAPRSFAVEPGSGATASYTNPDTGYEVVVLDDYDLLSDEEEGLLVEDMAPITAYGNVAFWSTNVRASNEIEQARQKRYSLFEYSSATIFVVNIGIRKLTIQSYGGLYESVTDSRARSITDNVSSLATKARYYEAARECYSQIYDVSQGFDISEPMKLTGYAVLSVILGFTIALIVAFSTRHNPLRAESEEIKGLSGSGMLSSKGKRELISVKKIETSSSGGGGGGGGGCGGGGGGCGGGGSSGF